MKHGDFMKVIPAPGFVLLELVAGYDPCTSFNDQPSRIIRLDPTYRGHLDVGMVVLVSDKCPDAKYIWDDAAAPVAMVPIHNIIGVIK